MKVIVCGANGAMGKLICGIFGDEVVGKVSIDGENNVPKTFAQLGEVAADVIVDFSHHTAVADVLAYAKQIRCAVVIGTTGHTEEEKALIYEAAKEIPVFFSGNVSLGMKIFLMLHLILVGIKSLVGYFLLLIAKGYLLKRTNII